MTARCKPLAWRSNPGYIHQNGEIHRMDTAENKRSRARQYKPILLRGTILNRTYGTHKNLNVYLFNQRYSVPFTMSPRNKECAVMLQHLSLLMPSNTTISKRLRMGVSPFSVWVVSGPASLSRYFVYLVLTRTGSRRQGSIGRNASGRKGRTN